MFVFVCVVFGCDLEFRLCVYFVFGCSLSVLVVWFVFGCLVGVRLFVLRCFR